jgi:ornithine cyclodeaminase/alanine dehydrogenase-like protein (mu-crystallin family)
MLVLQEKDVAGLLNMRQTIDALENAFHSQAAGTAANRPRVHVRLPDGGLGLQLLPGAINVEGAGGLLGFKVLVPAKSGARFVVLLSAESGQLLCMVAAGRLGQLRTGAATGLATKALASPHAASVGVFGAGLQAETQLEAICAVRPIKRALVYSPTPEKRESFAARMGERLDIEVAAVDAPENAAHADVVVTATNSATPVLQGAWLLPGTHINAIGANSLARRELDDAAVLKCAAIVVDSREQALGESLDIVSPLRGGAITLEEVRELHEVVSGTREGRRHARDITLFKSLGVGLEDVAVAALVYCRALEKEIGEQVRLFD